MKRRYFSDALAFLAVIVLGLVVSACQSAPSATEVSIVSPTLIPSTPARALTSGKLAFVSGRTGNLDIFMMNVDGTEQTQITTNPESDSAPAWSTDGAHLAWRSNREGNDDIFVISDDASGETNVTNMTANDFAPAWSPDGMWLSFTSDREENKHIFTMSIEDARSLDSQGDSTRLTAEHGNHEYGTWSHDSSRLAFASDHEGNYEIYVMTLGDDGHGAQHSELINLSNHPEKDYRPAWSLNGAEIAFDSFRDGNYEIYLVQADGSEMVNLTSNAGFDCCAAWSPDGQQVAFVSDRDGNYDIYVMSLEAALQGGAPTRLTDDPAVDTEPAWRP